MHNKTLKELSALLQSKQVSSVELTRHYLDRIDASSHNAFLHVDRQQTLAQAAAADARIADGTAGALTGVPIAHKDIFVTRGWRTTAGSKMLAGYESPFDATVVERFKRAGMVTLGKVNLDEFAMGSANENSAFGAVTNPWDPLAVPGGSSGGSDLESCTMRMNCLSICSVTVKSAITPSFIGRMASMLPGTLPSMALASAPTAWMVFLPLGPPSWRMETTDGSSRTMPLPRT